MQFQNKIKCNVWDDNVYSARAKDMKNIQGDLMLNSTNFYCQQIIFFVGLSFIYHQQVTNTFKEI